MPIYQGGQVKLSSGLAGTFMGAVERVQNVKIDVNLPRVNVGVMNKSKPLSQRPIINYTPVDFSFDFVKSNISIETMLGLVNTTGITAGMTDARTLGNSFAVRNAQVYFAPTASNTYNGLLDLKSGVLTNYSIQGSISEPVRGSVGMQFFDMSGSINNTARDSTAYGAQIVKPEGTYLTGILFTGYGITGVNIQSFSLGVGFNRTQVFQLGGTPFPVDRPMTEATATLQVQGYFEGVNNSMTGLSQYSCGDPTYGNVYLTLLSSCSSAGPTTYTMVNPYLDSQSLDGQVGGFSTCSFSFSLPLPINPSDTADGSLLSIT
jgi:hypothetical protein